MTLDFDWITAAETDALRDKAHSASADLRHSGAAQEYLKRVQEALRFVASRMKESQDGHIGDELLLEPYLEGNLWLFCDFELRAGHIKKRAAAACLNVRPDVISVTPCRAYSDAHASQLCGGDKEPMLIDVAEFIHDPKRISFTTLVCLRFIDEELLNNRVAVTKRSNAPDLTCKTSCIVGEGEPETLGFSSYWVNKGYNDVIKGASKISDSIPDDCIDCLAGLMK